VLLLEGIAWGGERNKEERKMDVNEALKQIAIYKYGQSRKSLIALADYVRDSYKNAARRKELKKRLTALLSSDATTDGKRFACKQLSIIGTAQEAPALAELLTDEKLSHMARFALERIPGPAANAALRDALGKAKGKVLIGIINSLGQRRDRRAVGALTKLIADPDETVSGVAAAALGKIGGRRAARALAKAKAEASPKLRRIVVDACLQCAERLLAQGRNDEAASIYQELCASSEAEHVRAAAKRGLEAARQK